MTASPPPSLDLEQRTKPNARAATPTARQNRTTHCNRADPFGIVLPPGVISTVSTHPGGAPAERETGPYASAGCVTLAPFEPFSFPVSVTTYTRNAALLPGAVRPQSVAQESVSAGRVATTVSPDAR